MSERSNDNETASDGFASIIRAKQLPSEHAKRLRREMTDAERLVWSRLRGDQLGAKFRRQLTIGPYIADFACPECRLVIEIDGNQHADNPNDARRTRRIESEGWYVIRFWNSDVAENLDGVIETIFNEMSGGSD